jgi:hypothetical protein
MQMLDYTVISEDTWELYAPVKEPDEWEPLMRGLSEGKIACLPYTDPKDRRAKRMSIARRARSWGFHTEARYTEAELAVRRVDSHAPPAAEKPRQRRRREHD